MHSTIFLFICVSSAFLGDLTETEEDDFVIFSPSRGFFTAPLEVVLTYVGEEAVQIYFTTDGKSDPRTSANASLYSTPLLIEKTTVVLAAAKSSQNQTRMVAHSYIFIADIIYSNYMDQSVVLEHGFDAVHDSLTSLPSISVTCDGLEEPVSKIGTLEFLSDVEELFVNAGFKYYGHGSLAFQKKSIRVYFKTNEFEGPSKLKNTTLFDSFPLPSNAFAPTDIHNQIQLFAGAHDSTQQPFCVHTNCAWLHNAYFDYTQLHFGHALCHGRYVHLYLNGEYHGLYYVRERLSSHFMAEYYGSQEKVYEAINKNVAFDGSGAAWSYLLSINSTTAFEDMSHLVDIRNFIEYMLLNMYATNGDWAWDKNWQSAGASVAGTGQAFVFFSSDSDLAFLPGQQFSNYTWVDGPGKLWSKLLNQRHPDFVALVNDLAYLHLRKPMGALTAEGAFAIHNTIAATINSSIVSEIARWPGNFSLADWTQGVVYKNTNWFPIRSDVLLFFLKSVGVYPSFDPPSFSSYGGADVIIAGPFLLTVNNSANFNKSPPVNLVVTYNGTDPKDALFDPAQVITDEIITVSLTSSTLVQARAVKIEASGTVHWSAICSNLYLIDSGTCDRCGKIIISEILYRPLVNKSTGDAEFIELRNLDDNVPVSLFGLQFSSGIKATFSPSDTIPAGGVFLLAKDLSTTSTSSAPSALFKGKLSNDGEKLEIRDEGKRVVLSQSYSAIFPWEQPPDLLGHSLLVKPSVIAKLKSLPIEERGALIAEGLLLSEPSSYLSSYAPGGTPGLLDEGLQEGAWLTSEEKVIDSLASSLCISEVLANAENDEDFIEMTTLSQQPVNLDGIYVTDQISKPLKLPLGPVTIAADDFAIFFPDSFALSKSGESLFIVPTITRTVSEYDFSSDSVIEKVKTVPTGTYFVTTFAASAQGVTLGPESLDNCSHLVPLQTPTPGYANSPLSKPLQLLQIVLDMPDSAVKIGALTHIILRNVDPKPILLYSRFSSAPVGWKISGVVYANLAEIDDSIDSLELFPGRHLVLTALGDATYEAPTEALFSDFNFTDLTALSKSFFSVAAMGSSSMLGGSGSGNLTVARSADGDFIVGPFRGINGSFEIGNGASIRVQRPLTIDDDDDDDENIAFVDVDIVAVASIAYSLALQTPALKLILNSSANEWRTENLLSCHAGEMCSPDCGYQGFCCAGVCARCTGDTNCSAAFPSVETAMARSTILDTTLVVLVLVSSAILLLLPIVTLVVLCSKHRTKQLLHGSRRSSSILAASRSTKGTSSFREFETPLMRRKKYLSRSRSLARSRRESGRSTRRESEKYSRRESAIEETLSGEVHRRHTYSGYRADQSVFRGLQRSN